jgi:hypothetical protein
MTINHHAKFETQPGRVPAMIFTLHLGNPSELRESSMPATASMSNVFAVDNPERIDL